MKMKLFSLLGSQQPKKNTLGYVLSKHAFQNENIACIYFAEDLIYVVQGDNCDVNNCKENVCGLAIFILMMAKKHNIIL